MGYCGKMSALPNPKWLVMDGGGKRAGMEGQLFAVAARISLLLRGLSLFIVFLGFNYSPPRPNLESCYPEDAQTTATHSKIAGGNVVSVWVCVLCPALWHQVLLASFLP